jgi:hypothetical protein
MVIKAHFFLEKKEWVLVSFCKKEANNALCNKCDVLKKARLTMVLVKEVSKNDAGFITRMKLVPCYETLVNLKQLVTFPFISKLSKNIHYILLGEKI